MDKKINVLSLFDGMSCLQIALKELNYPVGRYYASEIDPHAIKQTKHNFPETIELGDVTKWRNWDIEWSAIDLIGAGSPCQGFSFAGKQLAFNDPRSKLFFVFVDILNHIKQVNPNVKFLLENVRMKAEHEAVITQYVGVNPLYINSALVSAQNRERLYWTNIGMVQRGLFSEWYPGIPQPKDRGILLRDILESEVDEKYYLSEKMLNRITFQDKGNGEVANLNKGGERGSVYDVNNKMSCLAATDYKQPKQILQGVVNNYGIARYVEKSTCIDANYSNGMDNHAQRTIIVAQRGRGDDNTQQLEPNWSGKTNCLTSVQKDNLLLIPEATIKGYVEIAEGECFDFENPNSKTRRGRKMEDKSNCLMAQPTTNFMRYEGVRKDNLVIQLNPSKESGGQQPYQQNRIYDANGISPALCASLPSGSNAILTNSRIRRLTPTECSRLQTIPDWYKWNCSDTQIYRMLGNGWTCKVIEHILSYYNNGTQGTN